MKYDVCIVGLGYVGLTLATTMADVGITVLGLEKRDDVVALTNKGKPHFSEEGLGDVLADVTKNGALVATQFLESYAACDIYIITVGTPLDPSGKARLDFVEAATQQVAEHMEEGALVILRSTVKVGTARTVVLPLLAASGKPFDIALCPERTLEGQALHELRNIPQVVGADTVQARQRAAHLFSKLTPTVIELTSLEAGEILKLVDNTYRDVQFAFANEVARICDGFGVNAYEIIKGGKLGYSRTNVALPGLVGGPCLEKDPHILWQSAQEVGLDLLITKASRAVNENQPLETVAFIHKEYGARFGQKRPVIAMLGMAFKGIPATDDLRGAMSLKVLNALRQKFEQGDYRIYDSVVAESQLREVISDFNFCKTIQEAIQQTDVVIIANNHPEFRTYRPTTLFEWMNHNAFIYDYWNHFSSSYTEGGGDSYFSVGNAGKLA